MPQTLTVAAHLSPSLIAFKPRQVLLANAAMTKTKANTKPSSDHKTLILSSLAQYLERNGFSKTLKKFISEAQIEKDSLKGSLPDLEEIYKKYFESCDYNMNVISQKEQVNQPKTDGDVAISKKKKKNYDSDDQSKITDTKKLEEKMTNDTSSGLDIKSKEKKKSKKISDSLDQGTEQVSLEVCKEPSDKVTNELESEEPKKKDKEKKKKKSKVVPETLGDNEENQIVTDNKCVSKSEIENKSKDKKKKKNKVTSDSTVDTSKDDIKTSEVDVTNEVSQETKASKKRKRSSEENDAKPGDENTKENGHIGDETKKTPMKQINGQENGNLEKSEGKFSKKQRIGSAEPTSLKAFQRVKLDEVVFTDERLQDNSYWAKDGAETGYGAKAQEVLGQVRGRDFRHEKTKKKRGSYRGGHIDLESHSVKFNYSDEE